MNYNRTLEITQDHIDNAVHDTPDKCAIALAPEDEGVSDISISIDSMLFVEIDDVYGFKIFTSYSNCESLQSWQQDLISGFDCDPITLEFDKDSGIVIILEEV